MDTKNEPGIDWRGLFQEWKPYGIGQLLGDSSFTFRCDRHGIEGLARCDGAHFELIAVVSHTPGMGHFRAFAATLKRTFKRITVWSIMDPKLAAALRRYGFVPTLKTDEHGGMVYCYVWPAQNKIL